MPQGDSGLREASSFDAPNGFCYRGRQANGIRRTARFCLRDFMPTIFTIEGFRFFFYSNDHAPVHVHVQHGGGEAAFELGETVLLRESIGMKVQELHRAEEIVNARRAEIEEKWHETFG